LNVPDKIDVKICILAQAGKRKKRRNETVLNKHDKEGEQGLSNGGWGPGKLGPGAEGQGPGVGNEIWVRSARVAGARGRGPGNGIWVRLVNGGGGFSLFGLEIGLGSFGFPPAAA
jgi:hypothetical protein